MAEPAYDSRWGQWRDQAERVPGAGVSVPGHTKWQDKEAEVDRRWSPVAGHQCKTGSGAGVTVSGPAQPRQELYDLAEQVASQGKR